MAENENNSEVQPSKRELRKQKKLLRKEEKKSRQLLEVSDVCKGCGHSMALDQRFCSNCGAKRMYNRLNAYNLFDDFKDRFLNIENNFLRTFIDLFKSPRDVIDGYINGVRKKHLSAFSYFAISLTITGIYTFVFRKWFMDDSLMQQTLISGTSEAMVDESLEMSRKFIDWIFDNQSLLTFLNIPLYALMSKLVFWNYKKYNFIEHVVIYLYAYSHTQIIGSVIGIVFFWSKIAQVILGPLLLLLYIGYMGYVLMKLFDLTIEKIVLKTLLFAVVFGVVSFVVYGLLGYIGYKLGLFDSIIDSLKELGRKQRELNKAAKMAKDSIQLDSVRSLQKLAKDTLQFLAK